MSEILSLFFIIVIVGIIFSQTLLYIFDIICYLVLDLCIKFGNNWIQSRIAKILGA